jgi:hypothetical protein
LEGSKIRDLSQLQLKHGIKLYTTDIFYRETLALFNKDLISSTEKIKKPLTLFKENGYILKNNSLLVPYFTFPELDVEALFKEFNTNFDDWLSENNVIIIKTGQIKIEEVFNDYFKNSSPFNKTSKKCEFPDAFSLKAIESFCNSNETKVYILTGDKDILDYSHPKFCITNESTKLFDLIIRASKKSQTKIAVKLIESSFTSEKNWIEKDVNELFRRVVKDEVHSKYFVDDIEIEKINFIETSPIDVDKFSIIDLNIDKGQAMLECNASVSYEVGFTALDYSEAYYDKEDDRWFFVNNLDLTFNDEIDVSIQISVNFSLEKDLCHFEVESIENGNDLKIFDSFNRMK